MAKKRKFFPAEDHGSGIMRCLSNCEGQDVGPKVDDGTDKVFDPAIQQYHHSTTSGFWTPIREYKTEFVIYYDEEFYRYGYIAYLPQEQVIAHIKETTIVDIMKDGLGQIIKNTVYLPKIVRSKIGGTTYFQDGPFVPTECHVVWEVPTVIRKQGTAYNLTIVY